uniref:Putative ovule protein n=1 Tax=Solanum chacoense TaxID=4108 RepID=A0A0V0GHF1_SOLCH
MFPVNWKYLSHIQRVRVNWNPCSIVNAQILPSKISAAAAAAARLIFTLCISLMRKLDGQL